MLARRYIIEDPKHVAVLKVPYLINNVLSIVIFKYTK